MEAKLIGVEDALNFVMKVNLFIAEQVAIILDAPVNKVRDSNTIVQ